MSELQSESSILYTKEYVETSKVKDFAVCTKKIVNKRSNRFMVESSKKNKLSY